MDAELAQATIRENYQRVVETILLAAQKAGRNPADIHLVVVTKTHPVEVVQAAQAAGARDMGESYAEEGVEKIRALGSGFEATWHMIGHVQSRKASLVCTHFDYLHSLDSLKLARRLDGHCQGRRQRLPALLECNVSGEASKYGFQAYQESAWPELVPVFEEICALGRLDVRGLMTVAPLCSNPEEARPYFRRLHRLLEFLQKRVPGGNWAELSMGMTADYAVAVEEGATYVRVGTAILGARETH